MGWGPKCYIPSVLKFGMPFLEEKIFSGFYHIWAWRPSWSCDRISRSNFRSPYPWTLHIYPCIPHFCYKNVGLKGVHISRTCFRDEKHIKVPSEVCVLFYNALYIVIFNLSTFKIEKKYILCNRHFHLSVDSDADTYADCFAYLF